MIKFALKCPDGHGFESWFQSGATYDGLRAKGLVACPTCGRTDVDKALMAPAISSAPPLPPVQTPAANRPPRLDTRLDASLAALRAEIEAQSDYVGRDFATQARAMYLGEIPDRPIYGEAQIEEAKALLDDGVPVLPLPFMPTRQTN